MVDAASGWPTVSVHAAAGWCLFNIFSFHTQPRWVLLRVQGEPGARVVQTAVPLMPQERSAAFISLLMCLVRLVYQLSTVSRPVRRHLRGCLRLSIPRPAHALQASRLCCVPAVPWGEHAPMLLHPSSHLVRVPPAAPHVA